MQLGTLDVHNTALDGVLLLRPTPQTDLRGQGSTVFSAPAYAAFGLPTRFVADQFTRAYQGSLYGIYRSTDAHMAQLFTVLRGDVFMVAVDLRPRRQTFGKAITFMLNDRQTSQVSFAPGIAWGYAIMSETADIHQKFTSLPVAETMSGIFWQDAELNIQWPFQRPMISPEDANFPSLAQVLETIPRQPQLQPIVP